MSIIMVMVQAAVLNLPAAVSIFSGGDDGGKGAVDIVGDNDNVV